MLEALLADLEASSLASYFRVSRWGYAALSTLHVLGIAALVGSVVPWSLKLLGAWPGLPQAVIARVLVPTAAAGLLLAAAAGLALFSVKATDYAEVGVLQAKLLLIGLGAASALYAHWRYGLTLETAPRARLRLHALISLGCWLGALTCGRLIAFSEL